MSQYSQYAAHTQTPICVAQKQVKDESNRKAKKGKAENVYRIFRFLKFNLTEKICKYLLYNHQTFHSQ